MTHHRPESGAQNSRVQPRPSTRAASDGLGDRYVSFEAGSEACIETRFFAARLGDAAGFEPALRAQVERFGALRHPALTTVREVSRHERALCLVSRVPSGRRLFELVEEENGWAFALKVAREVLPALVALYHAGAGAHGAIGAPRIQLTREGRIVLVEHVLRPALETLHFSREEFRALGVIVPDGADEVRFSEQTDLAQLGYVALSLLLGRPLDAAGFPARVPVFLDEFVGGMGSPAAASKVRVWLERMMQIGQAPPFVSAANALLALEELSGDASVQAAESEGALLAFGSEHEADDPVEMVSTVPIPTKSSVTVIHPPLLTNFIAVPSVEAKPAAEPKPAAETKPAAEPTPVATAKPVDPPRPAVVRPLPQKVAAPTRAKTWLVGLSALVVAQAAAVAALLYWPPAADAGARGARADQVAATTSSPDELSVSALAPREPTGGSARGSKPASTRLQKAAPAPKTAPTGAAAPRVGGLTVASAIDLVVLEHGATIGSTGAPLAVSDGRHTLDFVNQALGFRLALPVSVAGGRMTTLKVPLPNGRVSINADPWARVTIDGTEVGSTPLANLAVPIGTHEVLFAHPQFGERRQTVVVKVDGIARVTQSFR